MEYVKIDTESRVNSQTLLSDCESFLATTMKRYAQYRKLRKHETALKSLLKRKINDLKETIANLNSNLPKLSHSFQGAMKAQSPDRDKLELEIDALSKRIEKLNN